MITAHKIGKLTLGHARSVVAITARPLWSYVTDATGAFILSVLPTLEVPPFMGDLSFVKRVRGKLSIKALGA